jgi:hypothetical protein
VNKIFDENNELVSENIFKEKYFTGEYAKKFLINKDSKNYFINFLKAIKYEFEETFEKYEMNNKNF